VSLARNKIRQAIESLKQGYLEMLYVILEQVCGEIDVVVSSDDLKKVGFDDSLEPDPDYQG